MPPAPPRSPCCTAEAGRGRGQTGRDPRRFDLADALRLLLEAVIVVFVLAGAAVFWRGPPLPDALPAGLLSAVRLLRAGACYLFAARIVFWLLRRLLATSSRAALVLSGLVSLGGFAPLGLFRAG